MIGPVMLDALTAHHAPNVTACNNTWWTKKGFSADH